MKFYVAGRWSERVVVRNLMEEIRTRGHEISYDWTEDVVEKLSCAINDVQGIRDAQQYVGIFKNAHPYQGALVELGGSLALGQTVHIIGHAIDDCIFMLHPLIRRYENIQNFLEWLEIYFEEEDDIHD